MPSSSSESLEEIERLRRTTLKAFTDAEGRFRIDRLGKGLFRSSGPAHGFLPTRVRQVAIPPGRGNADLGMIALQAGTAFEGRVVDPEGNPVAGASVQAAPSSGFSPGDLPADGEEPGREAVTGGDGAFSLLGFRDGETVSLRVSRRGFAARTVTRIETPLPEPLTVELTPAARIAGTVLDESGDPVAGAKLVLAEDSQEDPKAPSGGGSWPVAEVDSAGRFEMVDLAPGRFRLSALASGYLPDTRRDRSQEGGRSGWDRSGPAAGRRGRGARPGSGRLPRGRRAGDGADQPSETDLGLAGRPETFADNEGRYQLGGLAEGDRTVAAEHAGFRPVRRQVKVQAGTTPLDLQLERGFEISGRVTGPDGPVRAPFSTCWVERAFLLDERTGRRLSFRGRGRGALPRPGRDAGLCLGRRGGPARGRFGDEDGDPPGAGRRHRGP